VVEAADAQIIDADDVPVPEVEPPRRGLWPFVVVAVAVVFNLVVLRAEARSVWYPNDASVHRSMVAWAADRIEGGHLPLDGWYPDLALGSSRFHHYQSLPHVLTGLLAIPLGSERAVAWTLYLLLSTWPIAVYAGGRLMGWGRWTSALAALASPLIVSQPGLGYEWGSYVWRGYGTWTQLWGMWLLPLAWGLSWRAVDRGRSLALATLLVALTIACHLLTGYLALLSLGIWVLVRRRGFLRRLARAAVVGCGAVLVAAWVVYPLLADRAWTVRDEFSSNKPFYDSFGARRILGWFVTGELFDRWRFPILTILVMVGIAVCLWRLRSDVRARALLGVGLLSLLLFFGRPTLGPILRLLPGSGDLFLRRFIFGVHLAALYLIGIALARLGALSRDLARRWIPRASATPALAVVACVVTVLVLAPAWAERIGYESRAAAWIGQQAAVDATEGADVTALVRTAERMGPGRFYAGMRSNWGALFRIGQVPMYAALLANGVEGVGFTRPTWSLSSPIEYRFSDRDPDNYDLFDVRYVILPKGRFPPVQAERIAHSGDYTLWGVSTGGYSEVVDVLPAIEADRTNLGARMAPWLRSEKPGEGLFPSVAFAGHPGAPSTLPPGTREGPPGRVLAESVDLREGRGRVEVDLERPGMVVLKTSFDPRWQVTVDGHPAEPQMVAPSFVGRIVPAGRHEVVFTYEPFPRYDVLLLVGVLVLLGLALGPRWLTKRRGSHVRRRWDR
jgi:Family of unknown function (DUF6541)